MTQQSGDGLARTMRRGEAVGWTIFVLTALSVVFYLPGKFPTAPAISDSYLFGYNNRVGVLLIIFFLAIGAFFSNRLNVTFQKPSPSLGVPLRTVLLWMTVFMVGWAIMCFFTSGLGGFGESTYLIDRIHMLASGKTPYKDIEFTYGASFLYVPRWLMYLHLSAERAYLLFWLANLLAGIWLLGRTIDMLDYPSRRKGEIFSLICLFALPSVLSMGLNYTLFRFVPALYLALLVERRIARGQKRIAMLMSLLATGLVLLISPELALAYTAGMLGYFALFGIILEKDWKSLPAYTLLIVGEGCLLWQANRFHLFYTLKTFSRGADSFPIIPAGSILLFFFACGLISLYVAGRLRAGTRGDSILMVVAVSSGTLFAALGRCDFGHIGFAALGIQLVAMLLASANPRIWSSYRAMFVVFLVLGPTVSMLGLYRSLIVKAAVIRMFQEGPSNTATRLKFLIETSTARKIGVKKAHQSMELLRSASTITAEANLSDTYQHTSETLQAPFGYRPNQVGAAHPPAVDQGYFFGLINVFTPETVDRKIAELRAHPDRNLLLPANFEDQCKVDPLVEQKIIRILFLYPYRGRVKHSESVLEPLCGYIQNNYRVIQKAEPQGYGYEVWKANAVYIGH